MFLSGAKLQVRQLLLTSFLDHLEISPVVTSIEVASINVFTGVLDLEEDLVLAHLTGGLDLGSPASMLDDYDRFHESCLVVSEFVPLFVASLLSWAKREVEAMSKSHSLEVRVGAFESTL